MCLDFRMRRSWILWHMHEGYSDCEMFLCIFYCEKYPWWVLSVYAFGGVIFSFVFCCLPWILEMMQLFCLSCPLYWILSIIPNSFCEISFTLSVLYKTKWQGFRQNASLIFFGLCVWWKVLCLNEIQSITEMKFCHVPCTSNPLSLD